MVMWAIFLSVPECPYCKLFREGKMGKCLYFCAMKLQLCGTKLKTAAQIDDNLSQPLFIVGGKD